MNPCGDCAQCPKCLADLERIYVEIYDNRGFKRPTWDEMMASQREYDRLVGVLGGAPSDRTSGDAFETHKRIVRIMEGNEPEPSFAN